MLLIALTGNCSLERQEFMVRRVMQVCHTEFSFEGFVEVGDFFKELINAFRQMNYAESIVTNSASSRLRPMNWYPNVLKTNSAMAAKAFQKNLYQDRKHHQGYLYASCYGSR